MKPNALVLALITTASILPGSAHAADDFCSRLFIYAVNQICQLLPNGQTLCQPVGLAGPSESCDLPNPPTLVQVPLGPPSIQMPQISPFSALPNPALPNPFAAYPFAPMPYAPASGFPLPAAQAFALPNLTPPEYTLPSQPLLPQPASPPPKQAAVVLPATNPPQVAQPAKPAPAPASVVVTPAASAPVAAPLAKLMPENKPAISPIAEAEKPAPTAKVEIAPIKPIVESSATAQAGTGMPAQQPAQAQEVKSEALLPGIAPTQEKTVAAMTNLKPVETDTPPSANANSAPAAISKAPAVASANANSGTAAATASAPASVDQPKQAPVVTAVSVRDQAEAAREDALAHFEFDSAELTPLGRTMLDDWIKQAAGDVPVRVTGHADRLGPEPYNDKLSLLRAESVKKYLIQKGKTAKRIEILARGEKLPLISCAGDASPETKACLAPNRRAEINVMPGIRKAAKTATKPTKSKTLR